MTTKTKMPTVCVITRDGGFVTTTKNPMLWFHDNTSNSMFWNTHFEGYKVEKSDDYDIVDECDECGEEKPLYEHEVDFELNPGDPWGEVETETVCSCRSCLDD